jgi:hypothetical protein
MKQALHILRKDARKLWLPVAVTLVLLAALAHQDRWRSDYMPGFTEGWLNLLLPLVWALAVALVVHEELLTGDREFWITRPYRRASLVLAKGLFLLLAIHVPVLVADCAILIAREFQPVEWIPHLLRRQLVLALCVTLPAAALAATVGNVAHFLLAALLLGASWAVAGGTLSRLAQLPTPVDAMRFAFALLPLAAGAIAVLMIQYVRRRTTVARILGIFSAALALILFAYVPRETTASVACSLSSGDADTRAVDVRMAGSREVPEQLRYLWSTDSGVRIALPLEVSGLPTDRVMRVEQLALEISLPGGERFRAAGDSRYSRAARPLLFTASWTSYPSDTGPSYQLLWIHNSIWDRIRNRKVTVRGHVMASFYRQGQPAWLQVGAKATVPGVGRCYSILSEEQLFLGGLKLVCESPVELPRYTGVRLWDAQTGREWRGRLFDQGNFTTYPQVTWLSPLKRRQHWFQVAADPGPHPGSQWLIPRAALATAKIEIRPEHGTGCTSFRYELREVALAYYMLPPPPR